MTAIRRLQPNCNGKTLNPFSLAQTTHPALVDLNASRDSMEEWDSIKKRELQNWKGRVVCMTCQHFTYGVERHCRTMEACNLRQKQLQQGQQRRKCCKLWVAIGQKKMRWAAKVG